MIGTQTLPKRVAENVGAFTGRTWLLPRLLEWWDRSPERLFLLTGGPGTGKSMLMAWLAGLGPEPRDPSARDQLARFRGAVKAAYFCQASGGNSPKGFAEDVAKQLARTVEGFAAQVVSSVSDRAQVLTINSTVHAERAEHSQLTGVELTLNLGSLTDEPSFNRVFRDPLKALYEGGRVDPILILVDALDESLPYTGTPNLPDLLTRSGLPAPIRILVTTREAPEVLRFFRSSKRADLNRDASANVDDLRGYVHDRLTTLGPLRDDTREAFAVRLVKQADGIFLYAAMVLDELLARPLVDLPTLDAYPLPAGLNGLYHEFLLRRELGNDVPEWRRLYRPLLGLVAVAQGDGLTARQLTALVGSGRTETVLDPMEISDALRVCKPYLVGDLPDGPFCPFHKSFADFLLEEKDNVDFHIDAALMHSRVAEHYWSKHHGRWSNCDRYGLANLALHLFEGKQFDRLAGLISQGWMLARYDQDAHTYAGFRSDVELAWRAALSGDGDGDGEQALAQSVRCALIRTSINSASRNYVPALVARALEVGLWTPQQAFGLATGLAGQGAAALWVAILRTGRLNETERTQAQNHALQGALDIKDPRERGIALSSLAPHLGAQAKRRALSEGLKAAREIGDLPYRADALLAFAPQLDGEEKEPALEESLSAIQEVWDTWDRGADSWSRARALCKLSTHLTPDLARRGLEIAGFLEHASGRMRAQIALASCLPEESQALIVGEVLEAVERSLEVARGDGQRDAPGPDGGAPVAVGVLTVGDCFHVLAALIPRLSDEAGHRIVHAGLDALRTVDPQQRYSSIDRIAPVLSRDLALAAWGIVPDGEWGYRGPVLAALAARMLGEDRQRLFLETVTVLSSVEAADRSRTLAAWVPILDGQTRQDVLRDILDDIQKMAPVGLTDPAAAASASALESALPYLTGDLVRRGLDAALSPWCEHQRSHLLTLLAPNVTGELLVRSLNAFADIKDEASHVRALAALSARLAGPVREEALRDALGVAMQMRHAYPRACALAELAPLLVGEEKNRALREGLLAAEGSYPYTALVFEALAPHLTGELIEAGLATARECSRPDKRAEALAIMATQLSGEAKPLLAEEALAILAVVRPEQRARIVTRLAPHLDAKWHKPVWVMLQQLKASPERTEAVAAIAQALPGADKEHALRACLGEALQIDNPRHHVRAVVSLVPALTGDLRQEAIADCLRTASTISEGERLDAVAVLAPHFGEEERPGVVREAVECVPKAEEWRQASLLAALAPQLTGDLLERAAGIAEGIKDEGQRAQALSAVALRLIRESKQDRSRQALLGRLGSWLFSMRESPRSTLLNFCTTCLLTEGFLRKDTLAVVARDIREVAHEWHFHQSEGKPV